MKNVDRFDAQFFGIDDQAAAFVDPTERLLLECTYEAIVDAGKLGVGARQTSLVSILV